MTSISSFIHTAKLITTESGCTVNTKIDNIVIRVSCLGEYSSGKSALLNALLGGKFFAESITKETATATNVFYTKEDSYYITRNNDGIESEPLEFTSPFSTTTFGSNITEIDVYLNADKMAEFAKIDIFFTDLPGTNSGEESHEMIINETLINSNVILVCVPANQGTISVSLLEKVELIYLLNNKVQFIGITTKSDMPDIRDGGKSHCELLKTELLKIIPENLLACVTTDAKKNKIDALIQKLDSINDQYFIKYFFKKNAEVYKNELTKLLDSKIASFKKDKGEALESIAQKKYQVKLAKDKIEAEKEQFKASMAGTEQLVTKSVLNNLIDNVSSIKDTTSATNIATTALNAAFEQFVFPVIKEFSPSANKNEESLHISIDTSDITKNVVDVFGVTAAIIATIPGGIIPALAILIFGGIISFFSDSKEAKISKLLTSDDMRNKVKAQIADALSKMSDEVVKALTQALTTLDKNLENEKDYIALIKTKEDKETAIAKVETQKADIKRAYEKLETYSKK
jgi:GTPase SAR1 family protein